MNDIEVSPQESEERLGDYLKSTRESLNLSLEDIAKETNIRKYYLECFEENDSLPLLAVVISRGFLKAIAICLKLDPVVVLAKFDQERGIFELDETIGVSSFRPSLKRGRKNFLNVFSITIFLLLLLVILYIFSS